MNELVLIARSITYAQRIQCVLERGGVRARIYRAPRSLSDSGCAYGVRISSGDLTLALGLLRQNGLSPSNLYAKEQDQYKEVSYDLF